MIDRMPHTRAKHEMQRKNGALEKFIHTDIPEEFKTIAILAYTGAKPFSKLQLPYRNDFMEQITNVREALHSLGVPYEETIRSHHGGERIEFNIARDAEMLEQARRLDSAHVGTHGKYGEQWHREFGTLLGFPPTAVEAFVRHEPLLNHLPEEVRHTDIGRFYENAVMMRLSEAHWRQELKALEKWMEAIRDVSPAYLESLLSGSNAPRRSGH